MCPKLGPSRMCISTNYGFKWEKVALAVLLGAKEAAYMYKMGLKRCNKNKNKLYFYSTAEQNYATTKTFHRTPLERTTGAERRKNVSLRNQRLQFHGWGIMGPSKCKIIGTPGRSFSYLSVIISLISEQIRSKWCTDASVVLTSLLEMHLELVWWSHG